MPRAAHAIADHQPVYERAVVVRAMGVHREHFCPAAHQQDLLIADMANLFADGSKFDECDALRQVGAAGLGMGFSHSLPPSCNQNHIRRLRLTDMVFVAQYEALSVNQLS